MNSNLALIKQQAAQWLVKRSEPDFAQSEALLAWLNQSPLHQSTYQELQKTWHALAQVSHGSAPQSVKPRGFTAVFSKKILACAAAICCVAVSFMSLNDLSSPQYYQTAVATPQSFTLSDGSTITLNANSKVVIDMNDEHRQISIITGDAHFEVAADRQRPFVVSYKKHKFTALGTAFTVNTRPFVQLNVTEHQVKIDYQATAKIVREGYQSEFVNQWQPVTVSETNIDWREAKLIFNQRQLKDVLTQLQPYITEKIYLMDTSLADELVSGSINLNKPYQALALITQGMGLKLITKNNLIRLL